VKEHQDLKIKKLQNIILLLWYLCVHEWFPKKNLFVDPLFRYEL